MMNFFIIFISLFSINELCSFKQGKTGNYCIKNNLMAAAMGVSLGSSFRAEQSGFGLAFPGVHMKVNFLFAWFGRLIKS